MPLYQSFAGCKPQCGTPINWSAPLETDPKTVAAFLDAGSRALTLVKDALSH